MKKFLSVFLTLTLVLALLIPFGITSVSADEAPTLIHDQAELAAISLNGNYKLANDIEISGEWNGIIGAKEIEGKTETAGFAGTFDGDGHTITFAADTIVTGGLFQQINPGAIIKDLNIVADESVDWKIVSNLSGSGSPCVGGLVACVSVDAGKTGDVWHWHDETFMSDPKNAVRITNVSVNATINIIGEVGANNKVACGGIVGEIGLISLVKNCSFNGEIKDGAANRGVVEVNEYKCAYGGIIGAAIRNGGPVAIIGCTNNGNIEGYGQEGGILGYSYAWGFTATSAVGLKSIIIQKCTNNGTITCKQTDLGTTASPKRAAAGGIAGFVYVKSDGGAAAVFQHNINNGNVVAEAADDIKIAGGICGAIRQKNTETFEGNINFGSAKGQMIGLGTSSGKPVYINNYAITGDDTAKYTTFEEAGGVNAAYSALNEAYPNVYELKGEKIVLAASASGSGSSAADAPKALTLDVTVPQPTGTAITTQAQLEAVEEDGIYYLANDIVVKKPYKFIETFSGVLHGNGHTIVIDGAELRGGLIKTLAGAKIYNLSVTVSGTSTQRGQFTDDEATLCFGTIAAYGFGTLVNVTADYTVNSSLLNNATNAFVGGLIGVVTDGDTVIYNCYNTGSVKGGNAGGIVGSIACQNGKVEIARCANWGAISATSGAAGGIFAAHSMNALTATMSLLVLENVNYGAVSAIDGVYSGGIGGSVGSFLAGKASFLRNMNCGTVKANAEEIGCSGGILGYGGYNGILIAGNINTGSVVGSKVSNRLVAEIDIDDGITAENNFAAAVTDGTPATIGAVAGADIDADTFATLNAAYENAYVDGANIMLKWASEAGLSKTAPKVTYTIASEEQPNNNNNGTSETPAETEAPETTTEPTTTEQTATKKKKGCGSAIGVGGVVALLAICGFGVTAVTKRKED